MYQTQDSLYLILSLPAILLAMWAQYKVKASFKKGSEVFTSTGYTGEQAARIILDNNGMDNVKIEKISGFLSDHYDPSKKVLRLSPDVYDKASLSAVGVAAHEAGHAIQDKKKYKLLCIRNAVVPLANFGSNIGLMLVVAGWSMQKMGIVYFGLILFSMIVLFQVVNLPVEFDASNRAKALLPEYGIINNNEKKVISNVLGAAAMTYVAATISSITTLLYYLIRLGIIGQNKGRRKNG